MARFVIEMDGNSKTYGKVHLDGCRDCKDPEYVGDTFDEVVENWPWSEELEDDPRWVASLLMPCARVAAQSAQRVE